MKKTKVKFFTFIFVGLVILISIWLFNNRNTPIVYTDHNNNDIWDDVEPFIAKHAKTKDQKRALEFDLKNFQKILLHPEIGLIEKDQNGPIKIEQTATCLYKVWGDLEKTPDTRDMILTSRSRLNAWLNYNRNLGGGLYTSWNEKSMGSPCLFELSDEK